MSDKKTSRGDLILTAPVRTAGDLMGLVSCDPLLGPRKKEAYRAAIKSMCKGLRKEPHDVALSALRSTPNHLDPADCGISVRTFANNCSYLRRALTLVSANLLDTRHLSMTEDWQALFSAINDPHALKACGRFARWASHMGVVPRHVSQAVARQYEADLRSRMLTTNAKNAFAQFRRGWNRAMHLYPDIWPQVHLTSPPAVTKHVLPVEEIGPEFMRDLDAMLLAFSDKWLLPEAMTKPFDASTIREMRRIYLRMYSIARKECDSNICLRSMRDLVQIPAMNAVLLFYFKLYRPENTKSVSKYAHFAAVAARFWTGAPDELVERLIHWRRKHHVKRHGMTEKNRAVVRRFENDVTADKLLNFGQRALRAFEAMDSASARDALRLQTALAIELLIAAPVRPQNLCSIDLKRHLIWRGHGRGETALLQFPANEVKNDIDLEFRLPTRVVKLLRAYIGRARPLLTSPENSHLFPGKGLNHKGPGLLSNQLAEATLKATGARVTGHKFRHVLGFLYLRDNPTGHEVVRRFLGHKHIQTTLDFYAGMESTTAIRMLDESMDGLRKRLAAGRRIRAQLGNKQRNPRV